jgi:hypothetical protein
VEEAAITAPAAISLFIVDRPGGELLCDPRLIDAHGL